MNASNVTPTHATPGPWRFDAKRGAVVTSAGDSVAVVCFHGADSLAQENANGHLIAAAQDLRAALVDLLADAIAEEMDRYPSVLRARAALLMAGTDHQSGRRAPATLPPQWLRLPEVCARTTSGRTWIHDRMKDKTDPFPAGVRLSSSRMTVWDAEEVSAWMARRTAKTAPATD